MAARFFSSLREKRNICNRAITGVLLKVERRFLKGSLYCAFLQGTRKCTSCNRHVNNPGQRE